MNTRKRPISILALACLYALIGIFGFARNLHAFGEPDFIWIELTEVFAVIAGAFMFLGQNWARWLALAWMAFHLALSLAAPQAFAVHSVIFALIAWLLLRPEARQYFRVG